MTNPTILQSSLSETVYTRLISALFLSGEGDRIQYFYFYLQTLLGGEIIRVQRESQVNQTSYSSHRPDHSLTLSLQPGSNHSTTTILPRTVLLTLFEERLYNVFLIFVKNTHKIKYYCQNLNFNLFSTLFYFLLQIKIPNWAEWFYCLRLNIWSKCVGPTPNTQL